MKKLSFICGIVLAFTACEQHSPSELKSIDSQEHTAPAAKADKEAK